MKRISVKLIAGFTLIVALMVLASVYVYISVTKVSRGVQDLARYGNQQLLVGDLRYHLAWITMPANDYIITGEKEEYLKEFKEQAKILEEKFIVIEAIGLGESDRKIIEEVKTGVEGIKKIGYAIFDIEKPIGNPRAAELMEEMDYEYSAPAAEKAGLWSAI